MEWLTSDTLRALTPGIVLLVVSLMVARAWISDRNARLRDANARLQDMREMMQDWREAARESEKARDVDRENTRMSLEIARTSEAVIKGLRDALDRPEGRDKG